MKNSTKNVNKTECVVIGGSAGSTEVLQMIYGRLAPVLPWPVVICQHVHSSLNRSVFSSLGFGGGHPVKEAEEKEEIRSGCTYLAPPNYHLLIEKNRTFSLNIDEPVCYARPSIDVLFETAAKVYGPALAGILLTGANADGAAGLQQIHKSGGRTLVQDPQTAAYQEMPQRALQLIDPGSCLPPEGIADFLNQMIKESRDC